MDMDLGIMLDFYRPKYAKYFEQASKTYRNINKIMLKKIKNRDCIRIVLLNDSNFIKVSFACFVLQ